MKMFAGRGRSYGLVESLVPDPAEYAVANGLVGDHDPPSLHQVGVWRWPCVSKHRAAILPLIRGSRVIDFGGASGPLGYGSELVDYGAENKALYDVEGKVDAVFSSHTLEHVVDLPMVVECMRYKLKPGGRIIAHVPSWRTERWRAENWRLHNWTFCLDGDDAPEHYIRLDTMLGGETELADDFEGSILVVARYD